MLDKQEKIAYNKQKQDFLALYWRARNRAKFGQKNARKQKSTQDNKVNIYGTGLEKTSKTTTANFFRTVWIEERNRFFSEWVADKKAVFCSIRPLRNTVQETVAR